MQIELVTANATLKTEPTALPSSLPSSTATPPNSSIEYDAFTTGPLQASTTYAVRYFATTFATTANGCSQTASSAFTTFGSFTTQ